MRPGALNPAWQKMNYEDMYDFFDKYLKNTCSKLPKGRTFGVQLSGGMNAGPTGSVEIVVNYVSGEVSLFTSGGVTAGAPLAIGGAQLSGFTGFIYSNQDFSSNTQYSGPFTTGSMSFSGAFTGFSLFSSFTGTATTPKTLDPNAASVLGVGAGISLIPTLPGASVSQTTYSAPLSLGSFGGAGTGFFTPIDAIGYELQQACKGLQP